MLSIMLLVYYLSDMEFLLNYRCIKEVDQLLEELKKTLKNQYSSFIFFLIKILGPYLII